MDEYSFDFNPKDCNKVYFDELFLLLNAINPEEEKFKRIKKKSVNFKILYHRMLVDCVILVFTTRKKKYQLLSYYYGNHYD